MKKKYLIITGVVIILLLITTGLVLFFLRNKPKKEKTTGPISESQQTEHFPPQTIPSPAKSGEYNFLLMGTGDVSHEGASLTDAIQVVSLDTQNKKATLIFLPRDLYVMRADDSGKSKINEVYRTSGFEGIEKVTSSITNLPITKSIAIDFNGFTQVIDGLGGIEIAIEKAFDDYYYPIKGKELDLCDLSNEEIARVNQTLSGFELEKQFPCRYEQIHFDAGTSKINGAQALKYARSRHSTQDGSDFGRGARQQIVLVGLKNKLLSLEALKNVDKWFNKFIKLVKTDLDLETVKVIAGYIINPNQYEITKIVPSTNNVLKESRNGNGQFVLLPKAGENNWSEFQELIKQGL